MDTSEVMVGGFEFLHLIVAFFITAMFIFALYWLWTWPCGREDDEDRILPRKSAIVVPKLQPLYALELEPGIVVLQSEDGEFFRILREYDAADKTGQGCRTPPPASPGPDNQFIPSYTRAHYQTRPSAPAYPELETNQSDPFGDIPAWTPLRTLNAP